MFMPSVAFEACNISDSCSRFKTLIKAMTPIMTNKSKCVEKEMTVVLVKCSGNTKDLISGNVQALSSEMLYCC